MAAATSAVGTTGDALLIGDSLRYLPGVLGREDRRRLVARAAASNPSPMPNDVTGCAQMPIATQNKRVTTMIRGGFFSGSDVSIGFTI